MRSERELDQWMREHGGAAHSTDLRDAGFTVHGIRRAVGAGRLRRVRRAWLVSPTADSRVLAAVAAGGRLSCVSAAELAGWWTPKTEVVHVAVAPTASRAVGEGLRLHWATGPAPVGRTSVVDPTLNVLFHVARCLPLTDALPIWESAIRLRAVDPAVLARIQWRSEPARRLAVEASYLSDSGVETRFVLLMRTIGVTVRQQVHIDGHRVDGLIGRHLIIQIDGFAHHQAADRRRDIQADARLTLRGFTVLRFDYFQVLFEPELVISMVGAAMAQGLHL